MAILSSSWNMRKNLRNGAFTALYKNGIPLATGRFYNDEIKGQYTTYHKNGKIAYTCVFKNGIATEEQLYDMNGQQHIEKDIKCK
jgi:antitoxin component YwqK of YwqJK toxin-antitoxin module